MSRSKRQMPRWWRKDPKGRWWSTTWGRIYYSTVDSHYAKILDRGYSRETKMHSREERMLNWLAQQCEPGLEPLEGYVWTKRRKRAGRRVRQLRVIDELIERGFAERGRSKSSVCYGRNYLRITEAGIKAYETGQLAPPPTPKSERVERRGTRGRGRL